MIAKPHMRRVFAAAPAAIEGKQGSWLLLSSDAGWRGRHLLRSLGWNPVTEPMPAVLAVKTAGRVLPAAVLAVHAERQWNPGAVYTSRCDRARARASRKISLIAPPVDP